MDAIDRILCNNVETIQLMLDGLSDLHRVWMKFISPAGAYILTPGHRLQCCLCSLIRSCPEGFKKCRLSAARAGENKAGEPYTYRCHAGLLIMAVPLFIGHECIGAVATGEIKMGTPDERQSILKMVGVQGLRVDKALQYYEEIPIKKEEEIILLGNTLFDMCKCLLNLGTDSGALAGLDEPDGGSLTKGQMLIRDAAAFIMQNWMRPLTLNGVAAHFHLSPAYFSTLFSRYQGRGFSEFLAERRLERAKRLLRQDRALSICEVAQMIGYEDANYFSRVFKKKTGYAPTDYQKAVKPDLI